MRTTDGIMAFKYLMFYTHIVRFLRADQYPVAPGPEWWKVQWRLWP